MKKIMLGAALLLSGILCAETRELDIDAIDPQKVETVTYTFTIFKDESYDTQAWAELVDLAFQAIKRGIEADKTDGLNDEIVKSILQAIEKSCGYAGKEGIHGDLRVWCDNDDLLDEDPTKGCDGVCGGDDRKDK